MDAKERRAIHKAEAERAASEIEAKLAEYPQASYSVRVYGNPPTISVQLSVGAAHHLLGLIEVASRSGE